MLLSFLLGNAIAQLVNYFDFINNNKDSSQQNVENARKTETWSRTVLNCTRSCFYQFANYLYLFRFHQTKISWLFYDFLICFLSFYIFLWKYNSFMWIYTFKKENKFEEMLHLQPWRYMSISFHLHLYTNYPSFGRFHWRQKYCLWFLRCLLFLASCLFWRLSFFRLYFRLIIPKF